MKENGAPFIFSDLPKIIMSSRNTKGRFPKFRYGKRSFFEQCL